MSATPPARIAEYARCAASWLACILAHYSDREALILLKDIVRHVDAAADRVRADPSAMGSIEHLVTVMVQVRAAAAATSSFRTPVDSRFPPLLP